MHVTICQCLIRCTNCQPFGEGLSCIQPSIAARSDGFKRISICCVPIFISSTSFLIRTIKASGFSVIACPARSDANSRTASLIDASKAELSIACGLAIAAYCFMKLINYSMSLSLFFFKKRHFLWGWLSRSGSLKPSFKPAFISLLLCGKTDCFIFFSPLLLGCFCACCCA